MQQQRNKRAVDEYSRDPITTRAPTTTRTPDPLITSQVLYLLSYRGYATCA